MIESMLFRLFVFSWLAAAAVFSAGYCFEKYLSAGLGNLLLLLASYFMLIAYGLVLLAFLLFCGKTLATSLRRYWSPAEILKRRIACSSNQRLQVQRRHYFEKRQLLYRAEQQRRRLFQLNHKKQLQLLSKAIGHHLERSRTNLSAPAYRSFKRALRRQARAENVDALIRLHADILSNR